jgi:hypothetical protein
MVKCSFDFDEMVIGVRHKGFPLRIPAARRPDD